MSSIGFNEAKVNDRLVNKQLRLWNARCRASNKKADDLPGFRFLTVAKDEGSLGTEILEELSRQLDWHVFDEEIIGYIAQNSHVSENLVRSLDQISENNIQEIVERFFKTIEADTFGADEYREGLLVTFACLAKQGSAILVGRGANFALHNEMYGLKVRLTASPEVRIHRLAEKWNIPSEEARRRMQEVDERRRKFIYHYYWHDYDDWKFYDAVYSTDRTPVQNVVPSIKGLLNFTS
jgi:hypothetical protein